MKKIGVILARFQTPYLHKGHEYLLNEIRSKHNKVVVVLGVSPVKGSARNPFDYSTREKMLKQYSPELVMLPLRDMADDKVWSEHLDELLLTTFSQEAFVLYGSRDCFIPYYRGHLEVSALPEFGDYSATAIRDEHADRVLDTVDFRMGVNYAYHNVYDKVYPTVDIAVLSTDGQEVLLGKKHHATAWRFPGGFADPTDANYEASAARELKEECGDITVGKMEYVGSAKIDDWRYRSEADKILTLLFMTKLVSGEAKADDDLGEVGWIPVEELAGMVKEGKIVTEHAVLVSLLLQKLKA